MRAALRQLAATLRHRPAVLAGTLIAITLSSMVIVISASFVATGASTVVPPDRLAGAAVVVTGRQQVSATFGRGEDAETERLALPGYRRVPVALAGRLAAIPGVTRAVADVSFPVALDLGHGRVITGTAVTGPSGSRSTVPVTGHGWPSAALTPFRLVAGAAPATSGQIVIGAGLARSSGLHLGSAVWLAGRDLPALRVVGVTADGRDDAASATSVFFAAAQAAALYGHPGQADLVGVTGASGAAPAALAARVTTVLDSWGLRSGPGRYTVVTGAKRGPAEDLAAATDNLNLLEIGGSAGIDVVLIALFVVAGTVALAVGQRHHDYALQRAIGASPGQVRAAVLAELPALGVLGGVLGWGPGLWLAAAGMRAMVSHGLMPPATVAWQSPLLLLVATGTGVIVAMLSGLLAARRAGRARPADALREAHADRRWPHQVRIGLGAGALAGSGALVFAMSRVGGASQQLGLALSLLLALMITIALLGPVLVAAAELVLRLPARGCGVGGRLALADIRARPRRMASAVIPIALGIAFAGTVYFLDATIGHAAQVQGRQRLIASDVVTAPGPGLAPAALTAFTRQPGVTAAVGLTPASIIVDDPDLDLITGEVVAGGPLPSVLDLDVTAGSLRSFGPGDIVVSQQEAAGGEMGVRVGDRITVRLPDGAGYRARVTAVYRRSVGFADVMIPAAAAAGHLGSDAIGQILVQRGAGAPSLTAMSSTGMTSTGMTSTGMASTGLAARFAGLRVASRQVVNAQYQRLTAQQDLVSDMILGVIVLLAAVTVVNTLVMATADRRQMLLLLGRVCATPRQLLSMTACQSAVATVVGIGLGAAAAATTLTAVARAATGAGPYIPLTPALVIIGTVLALTMAATIGPAAAILAAAER
jgi:putative ABC transport system permease protein